MSTIETAISFTLVIIILTLLIVYPSDIIRDINNEKEAANLQFVSHINNEEQCQEKFCTVFSSASDCYRMLYRSVEGVIFDEED